MRLYQFVDSCFNHSHGNMVSRPFVVKDFNADWQIQVATAESTQFHRLGVPFGVQVIFDHLRSKLQLPSVATCVVDISKNFIKGVRLAKDAFHIFQTFAPKFKSKSSFALRLTNCRKQSTTLDLLGLGRTPCTECFSHVKHGRSHGLGTTVGAFVKDRHGQTTRRPQVVVKDKGFSPRRTCRVFHHFSFPNHLGCLAGCRGNMRHHRIRICRSSTGHTKSSHILEIHSTKREFHNHC
mmetsp:Transcript_17741/g.33663  ORF Transcript_17741/g.33663 Transcript_17741/m.33663 type:complete len:237 (-) Transcript_17741:86-796(-)